MADSPSPPQRFEITPADAGQRLDVLLRDRLRLSRKAVGELLAGGLVRVNERPMRPKAKGAILAAGDRVEVAAFTPPDQARALPAPDLPLAEVARGEGWTIVDKPPGVAVHPLRPDERDTMLNRLIARHSQVHGVGEGGLRSGVVHRLDVGTSGVLLFALSQARFIQFRQAFVQHTVAKTYRAIVHGRMAGGRREVMRLMVAQHKPARVRVVEAAEEGRGGRSCGLTWRAVALLPQATLVEVALETGFLHQIRAMLAHLGHPVIGDTRYGRDDDAYRFGASRPMLHACRLSLGEVQGAAEPPADFQAVLRRAGQ